MSSIVSNLILTLQNNTFEFGIAGIFLGVLFLIGLTYLFINRNRVMTLSYGLTLLTMVIFLLTCILTMLFTGIYLISV